MEAEALNTPTPDMKTVTQDDSTHIPDFAIERLARFFLPPDADVSFRKARRTFAV